ncbi:hypothetical protein QSH46_000995 [Xanthomonas arboricola pv. juglandis]|uniref:hypothetical protein n=1 Tax=Xanthomonas arboricola TaxID=56448 RepID=UPI000A671B34|nr:hypothetical protein [Xanthomonas arboricola]MDN0218689.1 hypothetical protein [Xanthomonas arboricola pv. juglandis]MDN0222938.1 hypothetical protein [Xanthomonas arboricola pv. juglandis]MDN0227213.1 hypothetical protein [Xanthomonas arboricola pv. juglandis]MDN0231509.1 hypothetical protein [Xanthomonas arboricola pv. juglandis]MDN0235714.1 hypothetical protein [Xanthomonas arboricola pv. juglandis]
MRFRFIYIGIMTIGALLSSSAKAEDTAIVCDTCTSLSQFQMAARGGVSGTNVNSEVLVVNPVTEQAIWISVLPRSGGGTRSQKNSEVYNKELLPGEPVTLIESAGIIRGKQQLDALASAAAPGYDFLNRDLTPDEKAEVGSLIKLSGKDTIVVLPPDDGSGYFNSYHGSIAEGTKLYVFNRVAASNEGLLKTALASRIRQLLTNRLAAYFGKQSRNCAVYNNGDSVCWQIDLMCPSCNTSINGTAKDVRGNILPSTGGEPIRGEGLTVVNTPPNVNYGPAGGNGSKGEVWLFCSFVGNQVQTCYLQRF